VSARLFERASLCGMAAGVALMLQPWWKRGMLVGFGVVLASVIAQNVCARWPTRKGSA
jgi:hypothetical protein